MKLSQKLLLFIFIITLLSPSLFAQTKFGGLALYTLRDDMGKDPKSTLQHVAEIGYAYVESAGYKDGKYYGMEPEDFKNYLNEIGLIPMSTHQSSITLDNADQQIADAKAAGFKFLVIPVPPMGHFKYDQKTQTMSMSDDLELLAGIFDTIGKKCKDAGLELLYHNHNFEYKKNEKGIVPIEYFLTNCDPEYVNFQMDLYWVTKAGADPVAYFKKYPGRFKSWHVKDMDPEGNFAPVGEGTIDFTRIWKERKISGLQCYFVEQDRTFGQKPMEVIRISHDGLKKFGFQ